MAQITQALTKDANAPVRNFVERSLEGLSVQGELRIYTRDILERTNVRIFYLGTPENVSPEESINLENSVTNCFFSYER